MRTVATEITCPKCKQRNSIGWLKGKYGIYIACPKCKTTMNWAELVHPLSSVGIQANGMQIILLLTAIIIIYAVVCILRV